MTVGLPERLEGSCLPTEALSATADDDRLMMTPSLRGGSNDITPTRACLGGDGG